MSVFPSKYEEFIYKRTYSRWIENLNRREKWSESVNRYREFFVNRVPYNISKENSDEFESAINSISTLDTMPSMRAFWSAGKALERENIAAYGCSYLPIDDPRSFSEMLYILMNGTGAGFSVERQNIAKLPSVPSGFISSESYAAIVVSDSKRGWAEAYRKLIDELYCGIIPSVDYSKIRPKGARLKTFGGRASGPEPLREMFNFTINVFREASGRKLNSIECHDICCKIANCVVVGGVRRSAGMSLSNLSDNRMRHAKDGKFYELHPHRALANNSVAYTEKPDMIIFMEEWMALMKSGSGERGIVNRESLIKTSRAIGRISPDETVEYGLNPCGEVILKPYSFCNLTEVVVRAGDTLLALKEKAKYATILGILQSTLTDFGFLRKVWKDNCEAERLLGVSLTGTCDHPILQERSEDAEYWLIEMRKVVNETAEKWAKILGINTPKAKTVVKPSGTISQLVNCSSGLHGRHSQYYIRRVRVTSNDPIASLLIESGVPYSPEVGETLEKNNTLVFEFPICGPETGSIERNDRTAIEQLEYWLMFKKYWCDHNPSVTIYVKDSEWMEVGAWVFKYWDFVGGLSFLPYDGGNYPLAPYEEIDRDRYEILSRSFPAIDFDDLYKFETVDNTVGSQEFACVGGNCELR